MPWPRRLAPRGADLSPYHTTTDRLLYDEGARHDFLGPLGVFDLSWHDLLGSRARSPAAGLRTEGRTPTP